MRFQVSPDGFQLLNPGEDAIAREEKDYDTIRIAQEAKERAEAERSAREERHRQEERQKESEERERKNEAEQRAQAAAAAAEADRKRRERERRERQRLEEEARAKAEAEAKRRKEKERDSIDRGEPSKGKRSNGDSRGSSEQAPDEKDMPDPEKTRTWRDRTGQFRVEAQFLGFSSGKLRLHKVNGVIIEVPTEKMSEEDLKYVAKVTKKEREHRRKSDDDDMPLEIRRQSLQPEPRTAPKPKKSSFDWFNFFLNAGCDIDDCTRYSSQFERDKMDETILPDITEETMRRLGLREGDIIRVRKAIEQRRPKKPADDPLAAQMRKDEELAMQLQAEENSKRGQPPNLFAGANGALKNNSVRRGRPQTGKPPLSSVDLGSITSASDQIQRTSSPIVNGSEKVASPSSVQPPARSNSAAPPAVSGFDDDAWTNRPSSTKPVAAPTPPVTAPAAPAQPPAPPAPPVQPTSTPAPTITTSPPAAPANPSATQTTGTTLAKTDDDIFQQLDRLSKLRTQSPAVQVPQRAPSVPIASPVSYQSGLGMGPSPVPMGQHLQNQQTGFVTPQQSLVRGPLAPVPSNQALLQPLVPTTTGFNGFVPTRPQSVQSPFANPPQQSPFANPTQQPQFSPLPQQQQPSFLSTQPTGFPGASPSLLPQQTGYPGLSPSPLQTQPTGFPAGNFGNTGSFLSQPPSNNFSSGPLLSQPTGILGGGYGAANGGFNSTPLFQANGGYGGIQSSKSQLLCER